MRSPVVCFHRGNAKTTIVATVSPLEKHFGESLSTLRFAQRAKQIPVHASVNEDYSLTAESLRRLKRQVKALKEENANLRAQLQQQQQQQQVSLLSPNGPRHLGLSSFVASSGDVPRSASRASSRSSRRGDSARRFHQSASGLASGRRGGGGNSMGGVGGGGGGGGGGGVGVGGGGGGGDLDGGGDGRFVRRSEGDLNDAIMERALAAKAERAMKELTYDSDGEDTEEKSGGSGGGGGGGSEDKKLPTSTTLVVPVTAATAAASKEANATLESAVARLEAEKEVLADDLGN